MSSAHPSSETARLDVAYVALGSNLGDRAAFLAAGRAALDALPGSRIVGASAVEETAPLGPQDQGPYLNQVVALETTLAPHQLLDQLLRIERDNGRARAHRWGPRTLDLDILCYDAQTASDGRLTVPHPELPNRDFWRRELGEARAAAAAAVASSGAGAAP